ncbi:MAG: sensor histidine kinase [bacterium]
MLFTAKTNPTNRQRHSARPLWRIALLVILLLLIPLFTYTALEISRTNEQETLLQNIYEAQLGAMLFSVNQYCWDVVNGWGSFLRAEISGGSGVPASSAHLAARLSNVQQRYPALAGAFCLEDGQIYLALSDSLKPRHHQVKQHIQNLLTAGAQGIEKMRAYASKGYDRPIVQQLHLDSTRQHLLFVFSFESGSAPPSLGGFFFSSESFVQQVLQPKISEFASQNFLLAVKQSGTNRIFFAEQEVAHETFEQEEALWVLPDMKLAIKLTGTSAAKIAAGRTRQTMFLMLGLDAVILIAAGLLLRVILREAQLARLKSDFVDHVSHDLRTPLGLIRMFAETLEMGRLASAEKQQEYYRVLSRESARLTRLVNNLLDFSRIEAGRKEYDKKPVALPALMQEALETYRFHMQQRGFALIENIEANVPPIVVDPEAVTQAFLNLLDNAIKYSEQEKHVTVSLGRAGNWAVIAVADRGLGIAPKHHDKIFGKFYRVEKIGQETRGAGIGLAIVQHVMQAHGGRVEVNSEPGKGSSFVLKFPLQCEQK